MPNELGRVLQALREQQKNWERLFLATIDMSADDLRAQLKAVAPEQRFAAAYVVGEKRLQWTSELIGLLTDPNPAVRQAARRSLVILSFLALNPDEAALLASPKPARAPNPLSQLKRPVDFGPAPQANRAARALAAEKWTTWWQEQRKMSKAKLVAASPGPGAGTLPDTDSGRLAAALLKAQGQRQKDVLKEYQDAKGVRYSEALALAAERLTGEVRREVRETLAQRLARMTEATLGDYLQDESAEIRRAALLGLAMRESTVHVQRMIEMLSDPEPAVARAAAASLRTLSGKDFGPKLNATLEEHDAAVARWREWAGSARPAPRGKAPLGST